MLKPVPRPSLTTLTTTLGEYMPSVATVETVGPEESGASEEAVVSEPTTVVTAAEEFCPTTSGHIAHVPYVPGISMAFSGPWLNYPRASLSSGPLTIPLHALMRPRD